MNNKASTELLNASNQELMLRILQSNSAKDDALAKADKILKKLGSRFPALTVADLRSISGIKNGEAQRILSAFELVSRIQLSEVNRPGLDPELLDVLNIPFNRNAPSPKKTIGHPRFIDLFAGIGGFHAAFHSAGAECVFASEWDKDAKKTYFHNFYKTSPNLFKSGNYIGDITKHDPHAIPNFDILTAGFPCQPFSQAGFKKGFNEIRGTLFFDIVKIIQAKQPQAFFLENVRHLYSHEGGKTFATIKRYIEDILGYSFYPNIVKATDYGLPQHRPRLFIVGFKNTSINFQFPKPYKKLKYSMSDIFGGQCDREVGYTLRVGGRGSSIEDRRNWDSYCVNGKVVQIGPKEGLKMQGFPDWFEFPDTVSRVQAMKQLGNSVAVTAVEAVAREIVKMLTSNDDRK